MGENKKTRWTDWLEREREVLIKSYQAQDWNQEGHKVRTQVGASSLMTLNEGLMMRDMLKRTDINRLF